MTVREIANWLEAEFEGDGAVRITGVAEIAAAGPTEVAFASGRKAARQLSASNAGCVMAPPDCPAPPGKTVIRCRDPRGAFARLIRRFHPPRPVPPGIHPSAIVSEDAEIAATASIGPYSTVGAGSKVGPGTVIGASCHIGDNVSLGANGRIHDNVSIHHDVSIGSNAVIHSGAVIGADGFGFVFVDDHYEKFPQVGRVEIGEHVEIGANSCVDRAALGVTRIGNGVKLDNLIHVAHNCEIGDHVVSAAQAGFSGGAKLGNYVVVGGQVGLGERAVIEDRAVAGGQCGLLPQKTIPAGETYWGTPARPIREHLEQLAQLRKLAALREQVARLEQRIAELENAGAS